MDSDWSWLYTLESEKNDMTRKLKPLHAWPVDKQTSASTSELIQIIQESSRKGSYMTQVHP